MLYLSREEVFGLLPHDRCLEVCEETLGMQARGEIQEVPRFQFDLDRGAWLRFMPAMIASKRLLGLRVYGGRPVRLMYILWDALDGTPLLMMEATAIRDIRTGCVGAIGAKYLSRPESEKVGVIGSGRVARNALIAHAQVRKLTRVRIFSPTREHRESFARDLGKSLNLEIEAVDAPEKAVEGADIVITGSSVNAVSTPAFRGAWLAPGMHLSALGGRAELDEAAVTGASRIIVDCKAQFPAECRDVTPAADKGLVSWDDMAELHEVVGGARPGRQKPEEITLLRTVGTSLQDLQPAGVVYALAKEKGIGREMGDLFPSMPGGGPPVRPQGAKPSR
jgi:ornithine cyclodeaminase/alanine dehydrogenase-like protein (mu-crystallin family)